MSGAGDSRHPVRPVGSNAPRARGDAGRPPARRGTVGTEPTETVADDEMEAGSGPQDTPPHGQPPVRPDAVRRAGSTVPAGEGNGAGNGAGNGVGSRGRADGRGAHRAEGRGAHRAEGRGARRAPDPVADGIPGRGGPHDRPDHDRPQDDHPHRLRHLGPVSPYHLRGRHRLARRTRLLVTLSGLVLLALVAVIAWYETSANPSGGPGKRVLVHVGRNESVGAVTATLAKKGVISSSFAFRLSMLFHGTPTVRPGGYSLRTNQAFGAVRAELAAGPNVFLVTVPSGFTISEIAHVLGTAPGNLSTSFVGEAKAGAVASPYQPAPGASLEGLLGTGTYELVPGETSRQLLGQMVARFDKQAAAAGLTPAAAAALGYTPYQLVTVASIAQKEGYFERYMGQVARVIYNRLAQGMPLAMTSTVLYALNQDGGTVTSADQQITSPYNTYIHTGLTPTPICTPSPTALAAAAKPPPGGWLYFELVTAKKGVMLFSTTFTHQLQAEQQAQANSVQNSG